MAKKSCIDYKNDFLSIYSPKITLGGLSKEDRLSIIAGCFLSINHISKDFFLKIDGKFSDINVLRNICKFIGEETPEELDSTVDILLCMCLEKKALGFNFDKEIDIFSSISVKYPINKYKESVLKVVLYTKSCPNVLSFFINKFDNESKIIDILVQSWILSLMKWDGIDIDVPFWCRAAELRFGESIIKKVFNKLWNLTYDQEREEITKQLFSRIWSIGWIKFFIPVYTKFSKTLMWWIFIIISLSFMTILLF